MSAGFEILAYEETDLGPVCLRRRQLLSDPSISVVEMTLNHEFLMSSLNTDSEQRLASEAIGRHGGSELTVLVGGLGLGYTALAALATDRVGAVVVVEFLPCVINWLKDNLIPAAQQLNADPRLQVNQGDIYETLSGDSTQQYDVILIDVDHSPEEWLHDQNAEFYSETSLRACGRHLAPEGILGIWSSAHSDHLADVLRTVYGNLVIETITWFNRHVQESVTDYLYFCRNTNSGPDKKRL